jgi:hypothetical protein
VRRLLATLTLAAAACTSPRTAAPPGDDPRAAVVREAGAVLRTGPVGADHPAEATYVYVDVQNDSNVDRLVTLSGDLLDEGGRAAAPLPPDEIRVPAHAARTFALVASKAVPEAKRARFHVGNAVAVDYPPQVAIEDFKLTRGDLAVATATAKNTIDKEMSAVVAATFYDPSGRILARPFVVVPLPVGGTRQLRFEGPRDAATATIFVGQMAFHY